MTGRFHADARTNRAEILRCETLLACPHGGNATCYALMSTGDHGAAFGGLCGEGHKGFLCAACEDGYTKIAGNCVECTNWNFFPALFHFATHLTIGLFLLHKSTKSYVSASEWSKIWYKVGGSNSTFTSFIPLYLSLFVSPSLYSSLLSLYAYFLYATR